MGGAKNNIRIKETIKGARDNKWSKKTIGGAKRQ